MTIVRRQLLAFAAATLALGFEPAFAAEEPTKKAPPPPPPASAKPEEIVRNLYERYAAEAYDYMDDSLRPRYFTRATSSLIGKVFEKSKKNDEPGIDYEPLIDGQDGEVKSLTIVATNSAPPKATVEARFTSFEDKVTVIFDFFNDGGGWKIDDIRGKDSSLKDICNKFLAE